MSAATWDGRRPRRVSTSASARARATSTMLAAVGIAMRPGMPGTEGSRKSNSSIPRFTRIAYSSNDSNPMPAAATATAVPAC